MSGPVIKRERAVPFSIRLTASEKRRLQAMAGDTPLGLYLRKLALAAGPSRKRSTRRALIPDQEALASILGALGNSGLSDHLKQIADAAVTGTHVIDREARRVIKRACDDIHVMRYLLLKALGLRADPATLPRMPLTQIFAFCAGRPRR